MSADKFVGHWTLLESENFDEYLKFVGVGYLQRKMAATVKPTVDIKIDGLKFKKFDAKNF
jgi:hypothetical protein